MLIQGLFSDTDELTEVQVIARDITKRLEFQEQLQIYEERDKAVVDRQDELVIRSKPGS